MKLHINILLYINVKNRRLIEQKRKEVILFPRTLGFAMGFIFITNCIDIKLFSNVYQQTLTYKKMKCLIMEDCSIIRWMY